MAAELESVLPPAPPSAVADWLDGCAGEELARRARVLETFESSLSATSSSGAGVSARQPLVPRHFAVIGASIAVCLAGASVALATRRPTQPQQPSAADSATVPLPSATAPEPDPGSATSEVEPAPSTPSSARPRRSGPRRVPQPARPSCDPPYTIEGDRKVFKRWCL
jgi:hypothetical protein